VVVTVVVVMMMMARRRLGCIHGLGDDAGNQGSCSCSCKCTHGSSSCRSSWRAFLHSQASAGVDQAVVLGVDSLA
jgi:hypothetical protein